MSREKYEAMYATDDDEDLPALDASVWYLFGRTAVPAILEERPNARFVVCLRNPVEMVPSLHAQKLYSGHETVEDLATAWSLSERRSQGDTEGVFGIDGGDPAHMAYKESCKLGAQLQELLAVVDREAVKFMMLEDLAADPHRTWAALCDHVGLPEIDIDYEPVNIRSQTRRSQRFHRAVVRLSRARRSLGLPSPGKLSSPVRRLNLQSGRYPRPPSSLSNEFLDHFAEDIALTEELIGRDLSHWRDID
jgi:hypothetical protein